MAEDRRLEVLRAIVQDYVHTGEPVGSRSLVERYSLGVSPATVRNDMAALEESGLIAQPHTSAGRVPTDLGYRVFVDRLSAIKPMSVPERRAIENFLRSSVDLDDVIDRTVRLLVQLTGQVAVVQYPSLRRSAIRHVELVPDGHDRLLVVIITDTGRVEQRTLPLWRTAESEEDPAWEEPDATTIAELRARVNAATVGCRLDDLAHVLDDLVAGTPERHRDLAATIATLIRDTLTAESEERVVLGGTANLARSTVDFVGTISPVLEALEEQVVLLRLLTEMVDDADSVRVRIGHENEHVGLSETSVVTVGYGSGEKAVARLGVLGPTRMDYPTTIAAVRAVARYVSALVVE